MGSDTRKELKVKEKTLKLHDVIQDKTYPHMYRVVYPDGELSADMYNRTRAVEHARCLDETLRHPIPQKQAEEQPEKPAGEFKS